MKKLLSLLLFSFLIIPAEVNAQQSSILLEETIENQINNGHVTYLNESSENTESTEALEEGEVIDGDYIIGKPIVSDASQEEVVDRSNLRRGPNYATNKEIAQFIYSGYIQFRGNYKTRQNEGSGLKPGRHVASGWIDYKRNNKSVIGGIKTTLIARGKWDSKIYSRSASARDSIVSGKHNRTYFYRGWKYFR